MKKTKNLISLLILVMIFLPSLPAKALTFNQGNIISDFDLTNYTSMSQSSIQEFLNRKSGTLNNLVTPDVNGIPRKASEIIYNSAQEHKINPMFLLVMLQKEMSLVEDPTPKQSQYDWAMGYGVCDSCSVNDPKLLLLKGFGTQVDRGGGIQRWYLDHVSEGWLKRAGQKYTIDGHEVTMANQATANLYNYTPHIHGNYNFWKIWNNWFSQKYPDGTLMQAVGEPGVWIIENGLRRAFMSKAALMSRYSLDGIVQVSPSELEKYEIGKPIKYSNYSLLQSESGDVYLLVDEKLRKFESSEVWKTLGYNPEEFEPIKTLELADYAFGEPITLLSSYPAGGLLQDIKTGGVFYVEDGKKYPITAKEVMLINFPHLKITPASAEELEKYPRLDPVKLKDGTLVKSKERSSVYVISDGKKLPIVSGEVFEALGYKWENIREVSEAGLTMIPYGNSIDLDYKN